MINGTKLHQWLLQRADQHSRNLAIFSVGAVVFFAGIGIILYGENRLTPSLGQEVIVLFGFVLATLGGLAAIVGYLSLSLLRFLRFINREKVNTPGSELPSNNSSSTQSPSTKNSSTQKKSL